MENSAQIEQGTGLDIGVLSVVERWVLLSALFLTVLSGVFWQTPLAVGSTAAGGLIAVLNLLILKRSVEGILFGSQKKKITLGIVVCFKLTLLLTTIWAAVRVLGLEPLGVALGVSALVMGIVIGTLGAQQQSTERVQPER